MGDPADIFQKAKPSPSQWRSIAERRFGDAKCLLESGDQERSNGAIYMAGFVIECLLKALLLERHRNLQGNVNPATLSESDKEVFGLLYSHALDDMVGFLPEVETKLTGVKTKSGRLAWHAFVEICEEWTVNARYSTRFAKLERAAEYLETVHEVKKWLKEL